MLKKFKKYNWITIAITTTLSLVLKGINNKTITPIRFSLTLVQLFAVQFIMVIVLIQLITILKDIRGK